MTTQPQDLALADALEKEKPFSLRRDMEPTLQAATRLRAQHADLERKDALLRQAQAALQDWVDWTDYVPIKTAESLAAITKELVK